MTGRGAFSPAVLEDDTIRLAVLMTPTTHALARLLSVIRSRGANVLDLHWRVTPVNSEGVATLLIGLSRSKQPHLRAAIARSADVRSISVL